MIQLPVLPFQIDLTQYIEFKESYNNIEIDINVYFYDNHDKRARYEFIEY